MFDNKDRTHRFFHRNLFLMVLIIIGLVFLFGHSRWGGWGHKKLFSGDPVKVEEKLADIEEEIIDELELRDEQMPAFKAYSKKLKAFAHKRVEQMSGMHKAAKGELEKDEPDMAYLAGLAKKMIRQRSTNEELETLVDETLTFYNTLDSEQQEEIIKHLKRHSRHH